MGSYGSYGSLSAHRAQMSRKPLHDMPFGIGFRGKLKRRDAIEKRSCRTRKLRRILTNVNSAHSPVFII